jgi:hypothetical protein
MYIGQWGADYWDPHTNADTFARNPDNADNAKSKPLAWRNAWDIPELTKQADAAVLERDAGQKRKAMYEEMQAELPQDQPLHDALPADRGGRLPQQRARPEDRPDVGHDLHVQGHQVSRPKARQLRFEPRQPDARPARRRCSRPAPLLSPGRELLMVIR